MTISADIRHFYRQFRQHQMATYGLSAIDHTGKTEHTGGSAAYGEHAYAAFMSAKRQIAFRKDLAASVAADRKRSRSAKRGWQSRKAA